MVGNFEADVVCGDAGFAGDLFGEQHGCAEAARFLGAECGCEFGKSEACVEDVIDDEDVFPAKFPFEVFDATDLAGGVSILVGLEATGLEAGGDGYGTQQIGEEEYGAVHEAEDDEFFTCVVVADELS